MKSGQNDPHGSYSMPSYAEAKKLARERLLQAERALDAYVYGAECDHETLKQLSEAVHAARCEVLDVLSELWPERWTQLIHSGF